MKDMKNLSESLEKVLKDYNLEKAFKQSQVFELWEEVVGTRIAQNSTPVRMDRGKLVIQVQSPAWRNEIQYYHEQIKREINKRLKEEVVKKIVFT